MRIFFLPPPSSTMHIQPPPHIPSAAAMPPASHPRRATPPFSGAVTCSRRRHRLPEVIHHPIGDAIAANLATRNPQPSLPPAIPLVPSEIGPQTPKTQILTSTTSHDAAAPRRLTNHPRPPSTQTQSSSSTSPALLLFVATDSDEFVTDTSTEFHPEYRQGLLSPILVSRFQFPSCQLPARGTKMTAPPTLAGHPDPQRPITVTPPLERWNKNPT